MQEREEQRHPSDGTVFYTIDGATMREQLLNLSYHGCSLKTALDKVDPGTPIEVTFVDGVTSHGNVVWTQPGTLGVRFHKKIGEATLRYFQLPEFEDEHSPELTDRFGRELPPMRSGLA